MLSLGPATPVGCKKVSESDDHRAGCTSAEAWAVMSRAAAATNAMRVKAPYKIERKFIWFSRG